MTTTGDPREDLGGSPACFLNQVCFECGRIIEDNFADICPYCGTSRYVGEQGSAAGSGKGSSGAENGRTAASLPVPSVEPSGSTSNPASHRATSAQ